jgi:hypothetical protein
MSNMSYCRFRNTLNDLDDCYEALCDEEELDDEDEKRARKKLIQLCQTIADEFGEGSDD